MSGVCLPVDPLAASKTFLLFMTFGPVVRNALTDKHDEDPNRLSFLLSLPFLQLGGRPVGCCIVFPCPVLQGR